MTVKEYLKQFPGKTILLSQIMRDLKISEEQGPKSKLIKELKSSESLGKFITGRRGGKSRFEVKNFRNENAPKVENFIPEKTYQKEESNTLPGVDEEFYNKIEEILNDSCVKIGELCSKRDASLDARKTAKSYMKKILAFSANFRTFQNMSKNGKQIWV